MLPRLTHLSFYSCVQKTDVVKGALEHCKRLRVLALVRAMHGGDVVGGKKGEREGEGGGGNAVRNMMRHEDPRVVSFGCKFSEEWEAGARGKRDMWAMADEVVAERLENIKSGIDTWDELQIDAEDRVLDFEPKVLLDDY